MSDLFKLAEKFNDDIKPPFDMSSVVEELGAWIQTHKNALLLAWFAQYGFEPGKAVLVQKYDLTEGSQFFIREMTEKEQLEYKINLNKYHPQNIYTEGQT
jgi:hypothetical protein